MKSTNRKLVSRLASTVLLSAAAVLSARADYPSTVQSYNPIGYWRFTETNASPALDIVTNYGTLGSAGNAYVIGNVIQGSPGLIGPSAFLSNPSAGSDVGSADAKIEIPFNQALCPKPPLSIEFWANPNSLTYDSTGYCPLENFDPNASSASRAGWLFYNNVAGRWEFRLGKNSGYLTILDDSSGQAASPGVWQHICVTWDGATCKLYVNGTLGGTSAAAAASWPNNTNSFLRMGATPLTGTGTTVTWESAYGNSGNRGYDGYLQHVAIYTNVLSASTVSAHYNAATTNNAGYSALVLASNPVGYWKLNEPAFTIPPATTFPVATNSGTLGSLGNGTNQYGTIEGVAGPGYAGFGTKTNAVFFDGENGYFQINDDPALHFANDGIAPNYISMAAWVKPSVDDFYRDIIEHGYDSADSETWLHITPIDFNTTSTYAGNGVQWYSTGSIDGTTGVQDSVAVPIPRGDIGNWVFLVGVYDGTFWNLYRDGQLIGQEVAMGGGPVDVLGPWCIGSRSPTSGTEFDNDIPTVAGQGYFFGGSIAEPAIFTNALSADDVYALYYAAQVPPVITTTLVNPGTVFTGASVAFSVGADGVTNLGYLWYSNGISTGDTTTNYSIANIQPGTYTVSVVVTNQFGTNTPSVTFPVVNAPPTITTQPDPSEERFVGYPFSFSVAATGTTPFTYFWKLGSTVVQAGPSATYSNIASLANAGTYTVIVSNASLVTVTSAPAVLIVNPIPGGYAGLVVTNGPLAYYRLDETSGTIAHDQIHGYDGVYNSTTLGVAGYSTIDSDTAVTFNGTNSYVGNITSAIDFAGTNNNSFSLEAWVNAPSGQADQSTIIAKGIGNNGTTEDEQFVLDVSGGAYRFYTFGGPTRPTAAVQAAVATDGPNGTWQHVVGVYDSSGQTLTIYVNGQNEGSITYTGPIAENGEPVNIGSKRTGNSPAYDGTFNGTVDEVAIYGKALSGGQVQADFNAAYGTTLRPQILIQPVGATNFAGLPAELSVTAVGSAPVTFQWYQGSTAVGGATSPTYSIAQLALSDAGSYHVIVSNNLGASNSISVPLVVLTAPTNAPSIPGLVMHLTFDDTLADVTGRGNNGVGKHTTVAAIGTNFPASSNAVTVAASPDVTGGSVNDLFYYTTDNAQPVSGSALHFTTEATLTTSGTSGTSLGTNNWYVNLGIRPDLQFGSNDFTVAYWIRLPIGYEAGDLPFFTDAVTSTGGNGYVFAPSYGLGTANPAPNPIPTHLGDWATSIYGGGAGVRLYGNIYTGPINDGHYHSLIHIVSRASNKITTYLDGVVCAYDVAGGTTLNAAGNINVNTNAVVGQDPTGWYGESGAYDIDDLGVWKRSLSALEAGAIYTAAVSNHLSFTAPVSLTIYGTNTTQLAITWPAGYGYLQSSTDPLGTFTTVAGATSPYVFTPSGAHVYYRLNQTNVYVLPH